MLLFDNISKITRFHISKVESGMILVNLGRILEIEEHSGHYALIVERMNEKQVIKFDKDVLLAIE
jgi:hypothetical protein